jgi:hypothetical protein
MAHMDGNILQDPWGISDVQERAKDYHSTELTDAEALAVLHQIADRFDANVGINWDVISWTIDELTASGKIAGAPYDEEGEE